MKIAGFLIGLVVLLALVGFVLPGHYRVERSTLISAKPAAIFPMVGDLRAWQRWGVWFRRDPAMQISYSPSTTDVGGWSEWTSKTQGNGKMTITSVQSPSLFVYRLDITDMGMASSGTIALAPGPDGATRVTAGMEGDLGRNPVNRWFGLFMDRMIGPDFDGGLANLKQISEKPSP